MYHVQYLHSTHICDLQMEPNKHKPSLALWGVLFCKTLLNIMENMLTQSELRRLKCLCPYYRAGVSLVSLAQHKEGKQGQASLALRKVKNTLPTPESSLFTLFIKSVLWFKGEVALFLEEHRRIPPPNTSAKCPGYRVFLDMPSQHRPSSLYRLLEDSD